MLGLVSFVSWSISCRSERCGDSGVDVHHAVTMVVDPARDRAAVQPNTSNARSATHSQPAYEKPATQFELLHPTFCTPSPSNLIREVAANAGRTLPHGYWSVLFEIASSRRLKKHADAVNDAHEKDHGLHPMPADSENLELAPADVPQ